MNTPLNTSGSVRATILDRLYQRINQLDDTALTALDALLAGSGPVEFVEAPPAVVSHPGRRAFLLTLLTGGAALAGGGATYLLTSGASLATKPAVVPTLPSSLRGSPLMTLTPSGPPTPGPEATISGLQAELTTARTEHLTLRAELDTARQQNTQLITDLSAREADIAYLQQVVELYRQMEAVGLDDTVSTGLSPVSLSLLAMATLRSLLAIGIQQASAVLATLEDQAPAIANGLIWLETQINTLAAALQSLEDTLSGLVEPVRPVAQQIGDFINQVLGLLPFGVGDNIRAGLQAIAALLTHVPELVASVNTLLITPLRQWISPEGDGGLLPNVVTPLRTNLVSPAQRMVDDSAALESAFNDSLKAPVEMALNARAALREDLIRLAGTA